MPADELGHLAAPYSGLRAASDLAAAVAVGRGVGRQHRDQGVGVALGGGAQEALGQLGALGAVGVEARPAVLHVALGPHQQLAAVVRACAPPPGRSRRTRSRTPRAAGTPPARPGSAAPAAPGRPATASPRSRPARRGRARGRSAAARAARGRCRTHGCTRADRRWSIARRVTTVDRNASGDSIAGPAPGAVHAQERLLDDVLGLRHAAHHPVGDREGQGPELFVGLGCGHLRFQTKPHPPL